jgi:hypothetical protein
LPLTYHIKEGNLDPEFIKFSEKFKEIENSILNGVPNQNNTGNF